MNSLFSLNSKRALVIGATSELGAHCSEVLLRNGATVVGAARNKERLKRLSDRLPVELQPGFYTQTMDVTDANTVVAGIHEAVDKVGAIDILLNAVSVSRPQSFVDIDETTWQFINETNFSGAYRLSKHIAQTMIESGTRGSIIHLTSILTQQVRPFQASYGAAKAAVERLVHNVAVELAPEGIRVNCIAPGYFATSSNRQFAKTPQGEVFIKSLVPRRLGQFSELDGALLLLASDAGSYISGTTIVVDGGSRLD